MSHIDVLLVVNKSFGGFEDFMRWRENGIAFKVADDKEDLVENMTMICCNGASIGYWGDIMTGPFMCFGKYKIIIICKKVD